jgi:plasmid stabilization system protein ParE
VVFRVSRARAVTADLAHIHDHLVESYCDLGDGIADALDRADGRVQSIEDAMTRLGSAPHQGTLCEDVVPRLRRVTKDKAILYFITDDELAEVRVLAVFFSGQDHLRHIVERLGVSGAQRPDDLR